MSESSTKDQLKASLKFPDVYGIRQLDVLDGAYSGSPPFPPFSQEHPKRTVKATSLYSKYINASMTKYEELRYGGGLCGGLRVFISSGCERDSGIRYNPLIVDMYKSEKTSLVEFVSKLALCKKWTF